jgi:CDP-diacylglycerol pyrophosphatase
MSIIQSRQFRGMHRLLFYGFLCIQVLIFSEIGHAANKSDILLEIVQTCINPKIPNYCQQCKIPQASANCAGKSSCTATSEVWAENNDYVVIRDIKMCGCPSNFVHGLVMPKAVVTGVEDERKKESIWQFSWDVAVQKIPADELALAVNSKSKRTQNQLHVHFVRLKPGHQPKLQSSVVGVVQNLESVWELAQREALSRQMPEHGILVMAAPQGGYQIAITAESPEGQFTQAVCVR